MSPRTTELFKVIKRKKKKEKRKEKKKKEKKKKDQSTVYLEDSLFFSSG
ncbi:hypothetical protein ACMBCN_01140 [Candidatus Liberibacter asiaticus]|nr:hypothetical protein [Candidatus Liberibacter asiaticus]